MKPILYLTQRFRPEYEATSKEINLLSNKFLGKIHDLHLDGYFKYRFNSRLSSYHFLYYPLGLIPLYLRSKNKIVHLYTSLCDRPYLPFLNKKKMIITSTNFFSQERIIQNRKHLDKVKGIIVQAEVQRQELLLAGITPEKIYLIYPPVELEKFTYQEPSGPFTILNVSCPGKVRDLEKRGICWLLDVEQYLADENIKFLWRGGEFSLFMDKIKHRNFKHINIENKIYTDMNGQYAQAHCLIIPYLQFDEYLKLIPTSVIESLAAGKPVLVSSRTGVAEIIRASNCGVVFEPTRESLLQAIVELRKNYRKYQQNCRKTAEKYFSPPEFLKKHEQIYAEIET